MSKNPHVISQKEVKHSDIKLANPDVHKEFPPITKDGNFIKYHSLLVDPPWSKLQTGRYGATQHYDLMPLDEIRALPINELMAEQGHLYLWVTNGVLEEAFQLLHDWGLTYRSIFTWVKPRLGLGQYFRNASEQILFATKGKAPVLFKGQMNWGFMPQQDHSHKPEEVYEIIERLSPGPYLELFARQKHPGWNVWGREIKSDVIIAGQPVPKYSFNFEELNSEAKKGVISKKFGKVSDA